MRAEILFPEVCNLYGDLQNVYYLRRCCPSLELVETDLHSRPRFLDGEVTLVFMGSTTEQGLRLAADALRPYAADIAARVDAGQLLLLTGNALDCSARPSKATAPTPLRVWASCPAAPVTR